MSLTALESVNQAAVEGQQKTYVTGVVSVSDQSSREAVGEE